MCIILRYDLGQSNTLPHYAPEKKMKPIVIVEQVLEEDGVVQIYSNGDSEKVPYLVDAEGQYYVELFPENPPVH